MPKLSVIIPTYNNEKYIIRAVDSALKQTFRDLEIIVIDDGSTDNTKNLLLPYLDRIHYFYQENGGVSAARNRGIQESKGDYIAFLDSDDYWMPEKAIEQIKILDANRNFGMVYARIPIINEKGENFGMYPAKGLCKNFNELLLTRGDIQPSAVMVRKECFSKAGMFDVTLTIGEDAEMWLRIAEIYEIYPMGDKVFAYYFRHDAQVTNNKIKLLQGQIKTDLKILNTFKEAPKTAIIKRVSLNEYVTAKEYFNLNSYDLSLCHLTQALKYNPLIGNMFYKIDDTFVYKLFRLTKPYLFLLVCFYKKFLHFGF